MTKPCTPTELLMHCLEEFGKSEPVQAMVIYTNEDGDLCWMSSTPKITAKIGMLECAKAYILYDQAHSDDPTGSE